MPRAVLDRDRVLALGGRPLSDSALDDLLFASKAEVEGHEGGSLTISVTPDRLDLLSEGGLGLYLQGVLETAHGIPAYRASRGSGGPTAAFAVASSVAPLRPAIAGAVVRAPTDRPLDAGLLAESVRFQELLHDTIGRDRRAASLGIYPVDRFEFPVRYALEPMRSVRFVPLDASEEVDAADFFRNHLMAQLYGPLGRLGDACLTLRDARGTILSLPPILNGRAAGEARVGDRELLIEATGTRERTVAEALGLLLVAFVAQGWSVSPVSIERVEGVSSDGTAVVHGHSVDLPASVLRTLGGEGLSASTVERRLAQARLTGHPHPGGWTVDAPPWRPDLMSAVDVAEDVLLAAGIRPEDGILPPSPTRGRLRRETVFRRRFASALLGLGLAAPHTPVLVSDASVARIGGDLPLHLRNPVSAEFSYLRNRLLLSHLDVLARNTRHGYPQRFGEVAPVVVASPGSETGGTTRYHAGIMVASDDAGFAEIAAMVEYLLRTVDVGAVREPVEIAGTIPGRAAQARVAGETVAELGEIAPALLEQLGVPVPVAWAEVDLSALWPLVAPREGV
jgi:phenylalanyl-tRNA synthetase beta chain